MTARPKTSEIDLHRSVADFLGWVVMPPAVWTTFPAGWAAMNRGAAGRLKGCGLQPGMPDILVFHDSCTIGIELKTERGKVSSEQLDLFNRLRMAGIVVCICRSVDDVEKALRTYKIPLRKFSYAPQKGLAPPEGCSQKEPPQGTAGTAA